MKVSAFLLILFLSPLTIIGQEAWLSTPESIHKFNEQVESMNPDTSQFELMVTNKTILIPGP